MKRRRICDFAEWHIQVLTTNVLSQYNRKKDKLEKYIHKHLPLRQCKSTMEK